MEYFCKYLSICYLGSANPSHGDKNSGEDGFPYIDWTAVPLLAGMQSWPRVASASICGLTNAEADERSEVAPPARGASIDRSQLNLGVRRTAPASHPGESWGRFREAGTEGFDDDAGVCWPECSILLCFARTSGVCELQARRVLPSPSSNGGSSSACICVGAPARREPRPAVTTCRGIRKAPSPTDAGPRRI